MTQMTKVHSHIISLEKYNPVCLDGVRELLEFPMSYKVTHIGNTYGVLNTLDRGCPFVNQKKVRNDKSSFVGTTHIK